MTLVTMFRIAVFSIITALVSQGASADGRHAASRSGVLLQPVYRYVIDLDRASPSRVRETARFFAERGFDVSGVNYPARQVELILTEGEIGLVEGRLGLRGNRRAQLGSERLDPRFMNPEKVEQKLRQLAAAYPQLATLHEIGRSVQGRPILALEVTSPSPRLKPSILFDGMHHAREIMTPEIPLDIAESLLTGAVSGRASRRWRSEARDILENARIWIVPMLNPDGNAIVWTSNTWWRKNARAEQSQVFGVDLNRNYSYNWGKCRGSSGEKRSDTYRGEAPSSEPETKAIIGLADRIKPIGNLSYHSFGEMILAPYGCQGILTGEHALLEAFGRRLASALPRDNSRGNYEFGTSWQLLYPVDGASKDFFFSAYGTITYTLEINNEFQPSYDLRDPTVRKHRAAWLLFMRDLLQNTLTVRVTDAAGRPARATIEIAEVPHRFGERPFATDENGVFFKVLAPGRYSLRVRTADGRGRDVSAEISGGPQSLEVRL